MSSPGPDTATRRAADVTLAKRAGVAASAPWEALREAATAARRESVLRQAELVALFTERATARGIEVVRAATAEEACRAVAAELGDAPGTLIKAKSMVTEEIGLRHHLERAGWTVYETDLGEWIVQVRGELPAHVTAPAIHLSAGEIAETLSGVLGRTLTSEPTALAGAAIDHLRVPLRAATVGVTGANFLIAETGEAVVVENEGNAYFSSSTPKHVLVTGIDKVVRTRSQIPALLKVLTASATGQAQTVYTHVLGAPREGKRTIVLVDNGRSRLAQSAYADAARCIRCGACMVVCPVFRQVSGHGYRTVYPGPIGIVVAPFLEPRAEPEDAPYFSTLCGACSEICPVTIPLAELIAKRRADLWEEGRAPAMVRQGVSLWKRAQRGGPVGALLRPVLRALLRYPALRRLGQWTRPGGRR